MSEQGRPGRYLVEIRERAVRMVFESECPCGSRWAAISSVAEKLGSTAEKMKHFTQDDLDVVAAKLDTRPRKRLGFDTPAARFEALLR